MSLPRTVKAVVFDMDGLLFDSESVYRDAMMATARDAGFELPDELFLQLVGIPWAGNVHLLKAHYGEAFDTEAFRKEATRRFHIVADAEICLKAGVIEILDHLDAARLPRAVATSSLHRTVQHHLGQHRLLERFDALVAQGDYARGKPAPDPFLTAAERLGVAPRDCLALEDSHNGVRAAHAAGMMTIMVPDLLHATEEMESLCVRIARDLHEVRELLEAQARSIQ
ncbi:MAG TPA: HAD family phosphatase [Phenylobacterium sp.]|jgi:HAD superfamily hydrolase (TIGR01509 family)